MIMKTLYRITIVAILMLMTSVTYAQSEDLIAKRAQQKVKQMTNYIEYMANKEKSLEDRKEYRILALNLFIGHGEPYTVNDAPRKGVYMQITSTYRKKPRERFMKDYFTGLVNLRYDKVEIESTDIKDIKVSELKKIGENEFECTCTFVQAFCGYRDDRPIYKDITKKRVTCHIFGEETVKVQENGEIKTSYEYIVLLGDVEALETTKG